MSTMEIILLVIAGCAVISLGWGIVVWTFLIKAAKKQVAEKMPPSMFTREIEPEPEKAKELTLVQKIQLLKKELEKEGIQYSFKGSDTLHKMREAQLHGYYGYLMDLKKRSSK